MDSLVAVAIHDAKNSLNALGVWLDRARHEATATGCKTVSPALEMATEITVALTGQLVELLALYRVGEGSLRMAVEDHSLADFLEDLMSEVRGASAEKAVLVIETDFAAATEIGEWAFDAYLVRFVLLDALRNARRHARQAIRFSLVSQHAGGLCFSVEDDGSGYPDDILRSAAGGGAADSSVMSATSSGLGLTFARVIAGSHKAPGDQHGRLELANDGLGKGGARFSLLLP